MGPTSCSYGTEKEEIVRGAEEVEVGDLSS